MTDSTNSVSFDEARAIVLAQRGDASAFGGLVRAYQQKAYSIAYGFVGNREDALELAQESFARAYKAMHRFDLQFPFYPWLYRIIKNTCLNHIKKQRRHAEVSLEELTHSGFDIADGDRIPDEHAELADMRASIAAAMNKLSAEHREILVLRHLQELSYTDIAQCLGVPQGTVMSRLHAARRNLRDIMQQPPATDVVKKVRP